MTEETNGNNNLPEEKSAAPLWGKVAIWLAAIGLLVVMLIQLINVNEGTVEVGEVVPDFTLYTFEGEEITLSELRGKVVLVNFWASWCNPCEDEAPELQRAWEYYQPGGEVVFLGIAWTDADTPAAEYMEKFQITYPNGHDLGTVISQEFRIGGVPETYIIDRNGVLASAKMGPYMSLEAILADIDAALAQ